MIKEEDQQSSPDYINSKRTVPLRQSYTTMYQTIFLGHCILCKILDINQESVKHIMTMKEVLENVVG